MSKVKEAEDSIILGTSSERIEISDKIDPIIQAVRDQVIEKQLNAVKNWIINDLGDESEESKKINNRQQLRGYLAEKQGLTDRAFNDTKLKSQLEGIEVSGYKAVRAEFADKFKPIDWETSPDGSKSKEIKNKDGVKLCTLRESTQQGINIDGVEVKGYRTVDFPTKLDQENSGPMHLSLAVKDENRRNIAADKAVYFTAHYDKEGKLTEVSAPMPVKFTGEGKDAVGYIEQDGKIYTLPVNRGKYQEMMLEVSKNQGMGVDLSPIPKQEPARAQDIVITHQQAIPIHEQRNKSKPEQQYISQKQQNGFAKKRSDLGSQNRKRLEEKGITLGVQRNKKKSDTEEKDQVLKQFSEINKYVMPNNTYKPNPNGFKETKQKQEKDEGLPLKKGNRIKLATINDTGKKSLGIPSEIPTLQKTPEKAKMQTPVEKTHKIRRTLSAGNITPSATPQSPVKKRTQSLSNIKSGRTV